MKNFNLTFFLILLINILFFNFVSSKEIKILKKINDELITNYDITKEYNYLNALNSNLKDIDLETAYKIAEQSIIKEKIKYHEIKKFFDLNKIDLDKILDPFIKNIINNLDLKNSLELEIYLKNYNLEIAELKNKLLVEILWNRLIYNKYNKEINIDENKFKKTIEQQVYNTNKITMYNLSEILIQPDSVDELNAKLKEIYSSISDIGFKNTALKYSISDTAKLGGSIGEFRKNVLSIEIKEALENLNIGENTEPLKIGNNFIILHINDKRIINNEQNKEVLLKEMVENEKQKQLNNFSQIYFNKVKINTQIHEF